MAFSAGGPFVRARYEAHACEVLYRWLRACRGEVNVPEPLTLPPSRVSEKIPRQEEDVERMQLEVIYCCYGLAEKRQSRPKAVQIRLHIESLPPSAIPYNPCVYSPVRLLLLSVFIMQYHVRSPKHIVYDKKNVTSGSRAYIPNPKIQSHPKQDLS